MGREVVDRIFAMENVPSLVEIDFYICSLLSMRLDNLSNEQSFEFEMSSTRLGTFSTMKFGHHLVPVLRIVIQSWLE